MKTRTDNLVKKLKKMQWTSNITDKERLDLIRGMSYKAVLEGIDKEKNARLAELYKVNYPRQMANGGFVKSDVPTKEEPPKKTTLIVAAETPKKSKYLLDKSLPKDAPLELQSIYNKYQNKVSDYHELKKQYDDAVKNKDIESTNRLKQNIDNVESEIRSLTFDFRRNPQNLTNEVMNDDFMKVGNKFQKVVKKYIPNVNTEVIPFYGDFTKVEQAIKSAKDRGENVRFALNFHAGDYAGGISTEDIYNKVNELGVVSTYCLSCYGEKQKDNYNKSNYNGDLYIREGTQWQDVADNPNVVIKDRNGNINEEATLANIMYSVVPDWNNSDGTKYKQGGDYKKITKNSVNKMAKGGFVAKKPELPISQVNTTVNGYKKPELLTPEDLPYFQGANGKPIDIVADVPSYPKYDLTAMMNNKYKDYPSELKNILDEYGKTIEEVRNLDNKTKDRKPTAKELDTYGEYDDKLNNLIEKFYNNKDNPSYADVSHLNYANNLANQLRDVYRTNVNVITRDKSSNGVTKTNNNTILISRDPEFENKVSAENTLFQPGNGRGSDMSIKQIINGIAMNIDPKITKYGVDTLLGIDKLKKDTASYLSNLYSTKNNSRIKKDVKFNESIPITLDNDGGAAGIYLSDKGIIQLDVGPNILGIRDKLPLPSTLLHEMAHSKFDDIVRSNPEVLQKIKNAVYPNNDQKVYNYEYLSTPTEVFARIKQVEKDIGVTEKDKGTKRVKEKLDAALKENKIKGRHYDDLLKVMPKENVIKLLNELAVNNDSNNTKNIT